MIIIQHQLLRRLNKFLKIFQKVCLNMVRKILRKCRILFLKFWTDTSKCFFLCLNIIYLKQIEHLSVRDPQNSLCSWASSKGKSASQNSQITRRLGQFSSLKYTKQKFAKYLQALTNILKNYKQKDTYTDTWP